jgi:hypothetical protein
MKLTTKKIIAQEFITLTLVLALGLISFLCTYPYNAFKQIQVVNKSTEISEKRKQSYSLSISYQSKLDKQNWFFEKFSNYYDLSGDTTLDSSNEVWKRFEWNALNNKIKYKWENFWAKDDISYFKEIGFSNPEALHSFIVKNRITKIDSTKYDSSKIINTNIALLTKSKSEYESDILSYNEQTDFTMKAIIIYFILFFGVRYFFYSLKWSLKILKQKPE